MPVIDVHSHLDLGRPQAGDIGDVLFYHFLRREIFSAGGDDEFLVSGKPLQERVTYFLKFLPLIQNTTTYWCAEKILKDLFGLEGDLDEAKWSTVNERIVETRDDPAWPETLLAGKLRIRKCLCCIGSVTGHEDQIRRSRPLLSPHLEGFSFGPEYIESLIGYVKDEAGAVPDNLELALEKLDLLVAEDRRRGIRSFGSAIDEHLMVAPGTESEAKRIYSDYVQGKQISLGERNILVTKFLYRFLEGIKEGGVVQWYIGAAWKFGGRMGKFGYGESYVYVNHDLIPHLLRVFKDFPRVNFSLMYCAESISQQLTIMARMLPNVSLLGFWWHNLFASKVERLISERIEALPANKWILTATDAYNCEWSYGKLSLIKECLARVLARKIEENRLTMDRAKSLASRILYENPRQIYNLNL